MKINYISDIHVEFYKDNFNPLEKFKITGDVLVIAGDLSIGKKVIPILQSLAENNPEKNIVYIPGNHEFYSRKFIPVKTIVDQIKENVTNENVFVLYRDIAIMDGVNFIGCVGWPDGSNGPISSWEYAQYNDFHQIHGFSSNCQKWGRADTIFLKNSLKKLKNQKNVVISHFLPVNELISKKFRGDYLNPCFANNWIRWINELEVEHWIYGHSHENIEKKIMNTNFYSNQLGYAHVQNNNFDDQKNFVI